MFRVINLSSYYFIPSFFQVGYFYFMIIVILCTAYPYIIFSCLKSHVVQRTTNFGFKLGDVSLIKRIQIKVDILLEKKK